MKSAILTITLLISVVSVPYAIVNANVADTFPLKPNQESEFSFQASTVISFGVAQIKQKYNYDVIVRSGATSSQLAVKLENPAVEDRLSKPQAKDLSHLQIPFLINLSADGEWVSIVTTPDETKISLEQKENIATILTTNNTELAELKTSLKAKPEGEPVWVVDVTPLGDCSSQNTLETVADSEIVHTKATRSNCTGSPKGGLLDNFGIDISQESVFEFSVTADKTTGKLSKAELVITMGVLTVPPADVTVKQQLEFVKYKEVGPEFDLGQLTIVHTVDELQKISSNSLF